MLTKLKDPNLYVSSKEPSWIFLSYKSLDYVISAAYMIDRYKKIEFGIKS